METTMQIQMKGLRLSTGMNMSEFSKRYGIPYRTFQSWEDGSRECPDYVYELLRRCVVHDQDFGLVDRIV